MTKCIGCGAELQTTYPNAIGYTPKEGSSYCQRCFRLIHYDDLSLSMRKGIDPSLVLHKLETMDGLFVWVVDLFDFEAGMIQGLAKRFEGKRLILAGTKRDLLPDTLSDGKLRQFLTERFQEQGIDLKEMYLLSLKEDAQLERLQTRLLQEHGNVIFFGRANSGKSTLINRLLHTDVLTSSRYPGTTIDFHAMEVNGHLWTDTPGIEVGQSMVMDVDEKLLKQLIPSRSIRPQVFQVYEAQSFAIGGLVRIDLDNVTEGSAVFYCSERLNVHRGNLVQADALWKKHYGDLLSPVPNEFPSTMHAVHKEGRKMDAVIDGLGWVCVSGEIGTLRVYAPKHVNVTFRKAMI